MPLQKSRPEPQRSATEPVPGLTHQSSAESVNSPITPSHDALTHASDKNLKINITDDHNVNTDKSPNPHSYPFPTPASAPATTTQFPDSEPSKVPSKDLPFLAQDPFADDDIIPFDKNKPIVPSRSGSVRSIMSTNSMQSLKRGLGSLKRKLSRRNPGSQSRRERRREERKLRAQAEPEPVEYAEDGITPIHRTQTYMMGPSSGKNGPRRVDTFQVSAMAF